MKISKENMKALPLSYMERIGRFGMENQVLMEKFKHTVDVEGDIVAIAFMNEMPEKCQYRVGITEFVENTHFKHDHIQGGFYCVLEIDHTEEAVMKTWVTLDAILFENGWIFDTTRYPFERYKKALLMQHQCELCIPILG